MKRFTTNRTQSCIRFSTRGLSAGLTTIGITLLLLLKVEHLSTPAVKSVAKSLDVVRKSISTFDRNSSYVAIYPGSFKGRGIGNQLFFFAAQLHVAQRTGKRIIMAAQDDPHNLLDRWFNITGITRLDESLMRDTLCPPCATINESRGLTYDSSILRQRRRKEMAGNNILLVGFFQSWRYTVGIESKLHNYLKPRSWLFDDVERFLKKLRNRRHGDGHCNAQSSDSMVFGIHVRAGDIASKFFFERGYTIPGRTYFEKAMRNLTQLVLLKDKRTSKRVGNCRRHVIFVVTSDNVKWCRKQIDFDSIAARMNREQQTLAVSVVYSINHSSGFDLVTLSRCDAVIMSTGTFGWWSAWLANKTTIYYQNWPRPGSFLAGQVRAQDFFPREWIPMGGRYFLPQH